LRRWLTEQWHLLAQTGLIADAGLGNIAGCLAPPTRLARNSQSLRHGMFIWLTQTLQLLANSHSQLLTRILSVDAANERHLQHWTECIESGFADHALSTPMVINDSGKRPFPFRPVARSNRRVADETSHRPEISQRLPRRRLQHSVCSPYSLPCIAGESPASQLYKLLVIR